MSIFWPAAVFRPVFRVNRQFVDAHAGAVFRYLRYFVGECQYLIVRSRSGYPKFCRGTVTSVTPPHSVPKALIGTSDNGDQGASAQDGPIMRCDVGASVFFSLGGE